MAVINGNYTLETKAMLQDRYRIDEVLSSNGISITYKAYDTFRDQVIVIKELYPEAIVERNKDDHKTVSCMRMIHEADMRKMKEHMIKEAKTMIKLYPLEGIANIKTYFEENGTVYIVSEYIEGDLLPVYIHKTHMPLLLVKDAFRMLKPVVASLEKLHKKGVVHGKIHPDSVCVNNGKAILMGFCDPMEDAASEVAEDATIRKAGYAPVEQYMHQGGYGPATDVYAIAAIIYEMVTAHKVPPFYERMGASITPDNPFEDLEAYDDFGNLIPGKTPKTNGTDPLLAPTYYNSRIMEYQSQALMKALSIYNFDRYQSIVEFVDAISEEEFADDYSLYVRSFNPGVKEWMRNYRVLYWGPIVCAIVFALIFVPKFKKMGTESNAKRFYTELQEASIYQKCSMIDDLSKGQRQAYANDYTVLSENGDYVIHYYDNVTKRLVTRSQMNFNDPILRYICLDYRMSGKAILSIVTDEGMTRYEIYLKETEQGYGIRETAPDGTVTSYYAAP